MKNKIYKYELAIIDSQQVQLTTHARILKVGEQNGRLYLWAIINTEKPIHNITITIIGTGHEVNEEYLKYDNDNNCYCKIHMGTVVMSNGLVWHVFM